MSIDNFYSSYAPFTYWCEKDVKMSWQDVKVSWQAAIGPNENSKGAVVRWREMNVPFSKFHC